MAFETMNEDMKFSIMDKMDLVTINDLRVCSWSTLNFVNKFSKRLEQKRPVNKLIFEKGQMSWKFESSSDCAIRASQRVGRRTIKKLDIDKETNIDQVIEFFRGSKASVETLTFGDCFPDKFTQILYLSMPREVNVMGWSDVNVDFSFLQHIPRSVWKLAFYVSEKCLINLAPRHIPRLSLGDKVCNTVPNTVIKRWLRGEQSIDTYFLLLKQFDEKEVFGGIEIVPCTNDQCRHVSAEEEWEKCSSAERCFRITRDNGDYLNLWNTDQDFNWIIIVATIV